MLQSLRFSTKVTAAASLVLVIILGLFTVNNFIVMRAQTQEQLTNVLHEISNSVSQNIANWLNDRLKIVESVANGHRENDSQETIVRRLQTADIAGEFKNAYLGMADGQFILDDPSIQLPANYDATTRPWYKLAEQTRSTAFTSPYVDVTTNELTISAVVPLFKNGRVDAVAGGDIDMATITEIINEIDFLGFGYGFLLDSKGRILSHPNTALNDKPMTELFGQQLALKKEFIELELNGVEKIISFVPMEGMNNVNWFLGVVVDKEIAYSSVSSFRNMALIYLIVGVLAIVLMLQILLKYLMKPVTELNNAIKDIAQGEGDLTQRLSCSSEDEFGDLSLQFNIFVDKIHESIKQVRSSTLALQQSIISMNKQANQSLELYHDQTKRTDNVATAINELSSSAKEISANAHNASELASEANTMSADSQTVLDSNIAGISSLSNKMAQAQDTVTSLDQHSASIGQVLEVIKGVSEQTNLLALNAAIEAARAGEAGRGFAVVADEVRQLAQRTQESTQEIENTISELQQGSTSAVSVMNEALKDSSDTNDKAALAGEKMHSVIAAIEAIDGVNHAVASATQQQNDVIHSLDADIHHISDISNQGVDNLNKSLEECKILQEQFKNLESILLKFKI